MKNRKGIILIFVLMVLATFSLLGVGLAFRARIENRLAQYFAAEYKNLYLAKTKLNQIMNKIARDDNAYDSFDEDWAIVQAIDLAQEGHLKVVVEDEDGKLNINSAGSKWLGNFFMSEGIGEQIVKARPFFVPEELFCLEDIDNSFYEEEINILDLVTASVHDKINVNTAREKVLRSMPGLSQSAADAIFSLRRNEPIDNLEILKETAGVSMDEYQALNKILKTTSSYYTVKIRIEDKRNKMSKSFRIILKKDLNNRSVEIVRWLEQ